TIAPATAELAKASPPPRIQRPTPLVTNYPKRSPVGKRKKNAPTTAGLSVEEFVAHIDELAEKAVEREPVPADQQEVPPKEILPPQPIPTKPLVAPNPPKAQETPKKRPKTTATINSLKRSPLGKLERKKKKQAKAEPPDE
ncbi:MAG TPA: hypothetical protein VKK79_08455, partial [Candidatus Lokiarchaeia archaeon]|nr:hypothetical protein [Candidatus Lokiarchaeia archaeon]